MDTAQAIPIGLIVNEAINNAFKYAFPTQNTGEIKIILSRVENEIFLSISDNGIGFKQAHQELNSLGLDLIKGLTLDLRGTITFDMNNGTNIRIRFITSQVEID